MNDLSKRINVTVSGSLLDALELYKKENFIKSSTVVIIMALRQFLEEKIDFVENNK